MPMSMISRRGRSLANRFHRASDEMSMAKPLDATLRNLFELEPAAWLVVFGAPVPDPGLVRVIDSNLSTVTAETDKLVRVGGPEP